MDELVSTLKGMIESTTTDARSNQNYRLVFDCNGSRVRIQMRNGTFTHQIKTSVYQKDRFLKRQSQQETNRRTAAI